MLIENRKCYISSQPDFQRASRVEIKSPQKNVNPECEPQNVNPRVHIFSCLKSKVHVFGKHFWILKFPRKQPINRNSIDRDLQYLSPWLGGIDRCNGLSSRFALLLADTLINRDDAFERDRRRT